MRVIGFDHLVLRTTDIERALTFYVGTLGLEPIHVPEWRAGTAGFPSVRISPATIVDFFATEQLPGDGAVDHFCIVVDPVDWHAEIANGLPVTLGPVVRFGAQGLAESVYLTDPDGNEIELRHYGPSLLVDAENTRSASRKQPR